MIEKILAELRELSEMTPEYISEHGGMKMWWLGVGDWIAEEVLETEGEENEQPGRLR